MKNELMQKGAKLLGLCAMLCTLAGQVQAEVKMVSVDQMRALMESKPAQLLIEKAEQDVEAERNRLQSLEKALADLEKKRKTDADFMNDAQRQKLGTEIEDTKSELVFLGKKLQKRINTEQRQIIQQLAPKFQAALKTLVDKHQYDLVVQQQALLYSSEAIDITGQVTQQINADHD